ncbi:GNAT family N-acetyltransferase [Priestia megaterium]|jgi:RimJ/RimL family protein N-acetyltransferase|uniref:GNAT family N-acetyltransferase n=1 Tax=Priestia megaterium TaxID=1404 RepID=UPI0004146AB7|nr:GNAT family N-acetyltransferase [Priestia megaterium]RFB26072.1 GNAT family N-acetyltransferase [Bacillus sp. ALD]RFB36648.1 GNAT family N-acetyltransferase [Bacillus sp. RC]MCR8862410.1 GNAT family N-acetyltransferase [Priestia megaterium]MCU7762760.1 GNAT family N-acetyltransferase [Priestia megaterium]MDC7781627.1 GNAT family N-acetyltransferase [Priestia megaterium]
MHCLEPKDYHKIHNILKASFKTPTFAFSVVNRVIQGSVYVNDSMKPTSGFLRIRAGDYYVFGQGNDLVFNNSLYRYFVEKVYGKEKRFTVFTPSTDWEALFDETFKPYVKKMIRSKYRFVPPKVPSKYNLPDLYELKDFNSDFLRGSENFNESYIVDYWGSESHFLKNGLGVCVIHKENIVAECVSIFHSGTIAEIDIVTNPSYRGQGLGKIVGQEFINKCLEKNVMPAWDCDNNNEASKALASKLGFSNEERYALYVLK